VGAVGERYDSEGSTWPAAAVVVPDGQPEAEHRANEVTYCQRDEARLSRWEKYHRVLKAEAYYEYPEQVRRESQKEARRRRRAIARRRKEAMDENSVLQDEQYWDTVMSALRMGWRTGHRDAEGREVWGFDD